MGKWLLLPILLFASGWSFEKLEKQYQIGYGDPAAPLQVTEYFSLGCPKCLDFLKNEFSIIKQKYIDTRQVFWIFHPDPADLKTLQLMVCLDHLQTEQKQLFFEVLFTHLEDQTPLACFIMQTTMESLKKPLADLDKMPFLETTRAFQKAFEFLRQKDVIKNIPTVEINGTIHETFPSRKFLEMTFDTLLNKGKQQ